MPGNHGKDNGAGPDRARQGEVQPAQRSGEVQGHDGGADGDLERQGRQGQRHRGPDGRLAAVAAEH